MHGAGDAPLSATVRHAGARVLDLRIGLRAGGRCLPQGLRYRGSARARVDERYTTPAGKRRDHRYVARRLVLAFRTGRTRAEVRLQASDDGVAWRTTVHGADVTAECSTAAAPAGARAWLQRYGTSYERPYEESALRAAAPGAIGFPALIGAGDHWALLAESGLGAGQPAARLRIRRGAPGVLRVERPVQRRATPWRVAVVGSPATIAGSDLVDDLAAPAAGVDWSWVRPGRVAWSWWADSGEPGEPGRAGGARRLRRPPGLGVRAGRRGLGPGLDAGARRVRPRTRGRRPAVVALGRAADARAARRAALAVGATGAWPA